MKRVDDQQRSDKEHDALLPCPCCGGKTVYGRVNEDGPSFGGEFVDCTQCGLSTNLMFPLKDSVTRELAEKWNKRCARSAGTRIVKTNDSGLGECPMCGLAEKVQVVRVVDPHSAFVVKCHGCGLTTGTYHHPDFAAAMWNSHLSLRGAPVAQTHIERLLCQSPDGRLALILATVDMLLEDVAEKPDRLTRAQELARRDIAPLFAQSATGVITLGEINAIILRESEGWAIQGQTMVANAVRALLPAMLIATTNATTDRKANP